MAIGAGLAATIGYVQEASYGASAAPTRFLPFEKESLALKIERDELGDQLGETTTGMRSDRWLAGKREVGGSVEHTVFNKGFGLIYKNMVGSAASSTPASGTLTRDWVFTPGSTTGLSLGVQVMRPDVAGTLFPFSYTGLKAVDWELSNSVSQFLKLSLNFAGKDESTSQASGAASYAASATPLHWAGAALTIAGSSFPGIVSDVAIKGTTGVKPERFGLGSSTLMAEPIQEELLSVSADVTTEFNTLADYNRFAAASHVALVCTWTGPLIEGSFYHSLTVSLPCCRTDGDTPTVDGPGRLMLKIPLKALYDGTNALITITARTTDTAL